MSGLTRAELVAELRRCDSVILRQEWVDLYKGLAAGEFIEPMMTCAEWQAVVSMRNNLPKIIAALQDADRLEAEVERLRKRVVLQNDMLNEQSDMMADVLVKHSDIPCDECGGPGTVDSGGFSPWGSSIEVPCSRCGSSRSTEQNAR